MHSFVRGGWHPSVNLVIIYKVQLCANTKGSFLAGMFGVCTAVRRSGLLLGSCGLFSKEEGMRPKVELEIRGGMLISCKVNVSNIEVFLLDHDLRPDVGRVKVDAVLDLDCIKAKNFITRQKSSKAAESLFKGTYGD